MKKNKTYDIIYMDPPWDYKGRQIVSHNNQKNPDGSWIETSTVEDHYPTMTDQQLKDLPINDMLSDDALVFMWIGTPILHRAMDIATHWGLQYSTIGFVWDKQRIVPGYYTLSSCEMVFIFKKGKIPKPRGSRKVRQFFSEKRREHSRKPDEIRNRIEEMFPTQTKLEMFARTTSPGWDVWGNEVDKF